MNLRPQLLLFAMMFPLPAATLWNENTQGDLSGDYLSPAVFTLQPGSNVLTVFTTGNDPELFTLNIPTGFQIELLNLTLYQHNNPGNETFLGFQNGPTLLKDPADFSFATASEISWLTYGMSDMNGNLFENISNSPNASVPPLQAGTYAFWINEIEPDPAITILDFVVTPTSIPEPSAPLLVGFAALLTGLRRSRNNVACVPPSTPGSGV